MTRIRKTKIMIDSDVALKLVKLGHMGETQSKVIKKLVNHAYTCDRWWLERDEELQL
jgi:predicted CopG family antitoxin